VTDASIIALPDFAARAAAIAAAGSAVALHARDRGASGLSLTATANRLLALARPAEASVFVNARPDIAAGIEAQGVQLGTLDLSAGETRTAFPQWHGWIGVSVHSAAEADAGAASGADFLMVGNVYQTASHPGRPAAGIGLIEQAARTGLPVIAIGGITPERAREAHQAGAYGVAAISAAWITEDPAAAAQALLAPWSEDA
jgi:thiamine-phosphate pyrophosphorylase